MDAVYGCLVLPLALGIVVALGWLLLGGEE